MNQEQIETDDNNCRKCGANDYINQKDKRNWSTFSECKVCGHKHEWCPIDRSGGALHQYILVWDGDEWGDSFRIYQIYLELEEAEKGFKPNGEKSVYSQYEKLTYMATRLYLKMNGQHENGEGN